MLRRDRHAVGGLTGDVRRRCIRDSPVHSELGQEVVDLRERRRCPGAGRRCVVSRQVGAVDRVRRGVVDRDRLLIPEDLDVSGIRLELDPAAAVAGDPQATRGASHQCGSGLADERPGREEVVRERDARSDAVGRVRRERVLDRLVERLRSGGRAAAARGDRDCRTSDGHGDHGDDEGDQAAGGESAQVAHGNPFGCSTVVVAGDSETSLRPGSSIVKRAPSAYARPP